MKSALNIVLMANSQSTEHYVKIPLKNFDVRSFCVELRPKQVLHRISVPMSYITFFEKSIFKVRFGHRCRAVGFTREYDLYMGAE